MYIIQKNSPIRLNITQKFEKPSLLFTYSLHLKNIFFSRNFYQWIVKNHLFEGYIDMGEDEHVNDELLPPGFKPIWIHFPSQSGVNIIQKLTEHEEIQKFKENVTFLYDVKKGEIEKECSNRNWKYQYRDSIYGIEDKAVVLDNLPWLLPEYVTRGINLLIIVTYPVFYTSKHYPYYSTWTTDTPTCIMLNSALDEEMIKRRDCNDLRELSTTLRLGTTRTDE